MFELIADSQIASLVREQAMPWVRAMHFLGIGLVLGTILVFDIRMLLVKSVARSNLSHSAARKPALIGFTIAALSGGLLVSTQPETYFSSPPFLAKMFLIAAAGLNFLAFERSNSKTVTTTVASKLCGFISLVCWTGVIVASCWIPFW